MTALPSNIDVVVVGAGPSGLAAACMLLSKEINTLVLDAAEAPPSTSRALVVHSRTLEILETIGMTNRILAKGDRLTAWTLSDGKKNIIANIDFSEMEAKYPLMISLPQAQTEFLLRERLQELGGSVYRSARVVDVVETPESVQLQVVTDGDATSTTVIAKYVVAADGMNSSIRSALDIPFEGDDYSQPFVLADCKLSTSGPLKPTAVHLHLSHGGALVVVPVPGGIWRIIAGTEDTAKDTSKEMLQSLCGSRLDGVQIEEVLWSSHFHIHHRLAKQYRKGRVFLAGDAAHVHSPAGGQGMNLGIQDGIRLAEILAEVILEHKDSNAALDRYEAERRPIAASVVALTHRITQMMTLKWPLLCWMRNWFIWGVMRQPWLRERMARRFAGLED